MVKSFGVEYPVYLSPLKGVPLEGEFWFVMVLWLGIFSFR